MFCICNKAVTLMGSLLLLGGLWGLTCSFCLGVAGLLKYDAIFGIGTIYGMNHLKL